MPAALPHDVPPNGARIHIPASSYYPSDPSYTTDHPHVTLPKVGQTRCYWALLSSELQFIYLDPVLQSHLEEQAELLVGKSLLSFVHPDEQATAKADLGGVLQSRTLHGSVTRVRFSRLSRVRRQLGYEGPPAAWSDADKIALDSNYMAVDIVINWAAEGLVLCFIHAIVDLDPNDNDEINKTGWTNWCGTPLMDQNQIQLLYRRLLVCVQRPDTMDRVFQILGNTPGRPLLLSWPPDQGQGQQRPNGRDFATLAENANIGTRLADGNDAKTSCTRRYKALQTMPPGVGGEVESIFIPHGSVIFACHKVNSSPRSTASSTASMQQLGYSTAQNYSPSPSYYESGPAPYALPPLPTSPSYPSYAAAYAPQRWAHGPGESSSYGTPVGANTSSQQPWGSPSPAHSVASLPPAVSNLRSGSYPPPPHPSHHWQTPGGPASPGFLDAGPGQFPRTASPAYGNYSPGAGSTEGASPGGEDVVPPARRRVSPSSAKEGQAPYPPSGRSAGNRPSGVLKCSSCKATTSPEWRKGPSGKKELCNACGLRYARSRAKKEGHAQPQRRRKDKPSAGITKQRAASATPPTSAVSAPYPTSAPAASSMRRFSGDTSFSSTGSASGSEIYHPHHVHGHVLDQKFTPSPSPPAGPGPMSFVHYAPGGPAHPHPHSYPHPHHTQPGSFYSVPSPLSHAPVQLPLDEHNAGVVGGVGVNGSSASAGASSASRPNHSQGPGPGPGQSNPAMTTTTTLPPLAGYPGRVAGSPLSTMPPPPASFERERESPREREVPREGQREGQSQSQSQREKDRELPPPVQSSVEPRPAHRRGILTQQG
ncbi:putative PAS domain containing protein [Lyophyllum shimeji]|uniref:PAS domain containing protein n=1 Tax=Lyophyllum shimeji TaxID=47721 RepID=A0A9P3PR36_LYOSH|nr:putative PAS domain containing protein [Lyophyllum shimeji]